MKTLYLAFANSEDNHLPNLLREVRGIRDALLTAKRAKELDFIITENTDSDTFCEVVRKLGTQINFLHFSGHAGPKGIELFERVFSAQNLRDVLSVWKDNQTLEFVFLNGCCTQALAEFFFNIGVKAVVATRYKIPDPQAANLSIHFYENLSLPDGSHDVERAFKLACANLNIPTDTAFVHRGAIDIEDGDGEIPWKLCYADDDAKAVKLIQDAGSVPALSASEQQLMDQLGSLKKDISLAEKLLKLDASDADALALLKEKSANYAAIYEQLTRGADRQQIKGALYSLNYGSQDEKFIDSPAKRTGQPLALLALGTKACGLGLWVKRCLSAAQLDHMARSGLASDVKKIAVQFDRSAAARVSHQNIWQEVALQVKEAQPESDAPESILKAIEQRFLGGPTPQNVVFLFDNIQAVQDDEDIGKLIEAFWFKLYTYFNGKNLPRKVLLFLIDRGVQSEGEHEDEDFGAVARRDYAALFPGQNLEQERGLCLLPPVSILEDDTLKRWFASQSWLLGRYFSEPKECLPQGKPFMMPTIEHILLKTNLKDEIERFQQVDQLVF